MSEEKLIKELDAAMDSNDPIAEWTSETEVGQLLTAVARLHGCKTIVELGVFKGYTSCLLANVAEKYIGIDIEDFRSEEVKDLFKKLKGKFILGDSVMEVNKMEYASIDLAFIDSFHDFDHVMREWKAIEPRMKKGGIVAFHDSIHIPDVAKMMRYIKSFRHFEVITLNTTDPNVNRGLTLVKCL